MPPLPGGFRAEMRDLLGEGRASRLLSALDSEPGVSVRVNPRKAGEAAALFPGASPVQWAENGLYLSARPRFALMPEWHGGAFYVQDASSMFIGRAISTLMARYGLEPHAVLDLCAAPGGKTTAALDVLPEGAVCVANEVIPARASVLRENLLKWGRSDVIVTSAPASKFSKLRDVFDLIIADVPCSGEGMMRKEADARRQWSPGLVAQCAALQREITGEVVDALKPGGFLIYSTCTFNADEDERNVAFLAEEYGLEPVALDVPDGCGVSPQVEGTAPCLRFLPGEIRGEGLFMAALRKPDGDARPRKAPKLPKPAKNAPKGWVAPDLTIYDREGSLYALSDDGARMLARLTDAGIGILSAGVPVAAAKGKDFVPRGALAWSESLLPDAFPDVELTEEQALTYLRREPVALPADAPRDYLTVSCRGVRLGFLKNLGNRSNNLYPQEYRLRVKL